MSIIGSAIGSAVGGSIRARLAQALAAAIAAGLGSLVKVGSADAAAAARVAPDGSVAQRVADLAAQTNEPHVHLAQADVQHMIEHLPEDDCPSQR